MVKINNIYSASGGITASLSQGLVLTLYSIFTSDFTTNNDSAGDFRADDGVFITSRKMSKAIVKRLLLLQVFE